MCVIDTNFPLFFCGNQSQTFFVSLSSTFHVLIHFVDGNNVICSFLKKLNVLIQFVFRKYSTIYEEVFILFIAPDLKIMINMVVTSSICQIIMLTNKLDKHNLRQQKDRFI